MNTLKRRAQHHCSQPLITEMGSEFSAGALRRIQKNLCTEGDALLRMENEGGVPLSIIQSAKVDDFFKVSKRIRREFFTSKTPTN